MEEGDQERFLDNSPLNQLGGEARPDSAINSGLGNSGSGGIITARGTSEGLVIRLDGRVETADLRGALEDFLEARKAFLAGQEVSLEWVGTKASDETVQELTHLLQANFSIKVKSSRLRESSLPEGQRLEGKRRESKSSAAPSGEEVRQPKSVGESAKSGSGPRLSLFDGMEVIGESRVDPSLTASQRTLGGPIGGGISGSIAASGAALSSADAFWDDADARIVYTTLRSGQKIETDHSLIIMGDVNSGAEIIAGGDIIILGTLRGVAHAGAYDETGGGRIIFALNLQATQLRIGMVISRGSSDTQRVPEIARVEGGLIVVEAYTSKSLASRRRE